MLTTILLGGRRDEKGTFIAKRKNRNGCPCILDTDAKGKCDRYVHLGMKLVQTRKAGGCKIYDLMYSKDGV